MISFLNNLKNHKSLRFGFYIFILLYLLTIFILFTKSIAFTDITNNKGFPNDFVPYYAGAIILIEQPENLYNFQIQHSTQDRLINVKNNEYLQYLYPPVATYIFLPFTFTSIKSGYVIWLFINTLTLGVFLLGFFKYYKNYGWWVRIALVIAIISFIPTILNLGLGQISLFLSIFFLSSWLLYKKNKDFLSGLLLSAFFIKPQYLPLLFIAVLALRNAKMLFGFLTGLAIMLISSIATTGVEGFLKYFTFLEKYSTKVNEFTRDIYSMGNIQSITSSYFGHNTELGNIIYISLSILIAILIIYTWSLKIKKSEYISNMRWGALTIAMLLVSPHTNHQDFMLIISLFIILIPKKKSDFIRFPKRIKYFIFSLFPISYLFYNYNPYNKTIYIIFLLVILFFMFYEIHTQSKNATKGTQHLANL